MEFAIRLFLIEAAVRVRMLFRPLPLTIIAMIICAFIAGRMW